MRTSPNLRHSSSTSFSELCTDLGIRLAKWEAESGQRFRRHHHDHHEKDGGVHDDADDDAEGLRAVSVAQVLLLAKSEQISLFFARLPND